MADPFTAAMTGFQGILGANKAYEEGKAAEAARAKSQWESLGSMVQDYAAAGDDPEAQKMVDAKANFLLKGFGIKGGDAKDYINMLKSSGKEQLTGLYNKMFEMGVDPNAIKPGDYFKLPRDQQLKMLSGAAERQALTSTVQPDTLSTPRTGAQAGMPITGLPSEAAGAVPGGMPNAAAVPIPQMPTVNQIGAPPVAASPLAPPAGPDTIAAPPAMGGDQGTKKILGADGQPVAVPATTGGMPAGPRPARAPDEVLPDRAAPGTPATPEGQIHSPYTGNVQNLQLALQNTPAMQNLRDSLKLRSQAEQLRARAGSLPPGSEGAAAMIERADKLNQQAKAAEGKANIPLTGEAANQYLGGALSGKKGAIVSVNLMDGTATLTAPGTPTTSILPRSHPAYEGKPKGTIIGIDNVSNEPKELIKGTSRVIPMTDEEREAKGFPEGQWGYTEDMQGNKDYKMIQGPDIRQQGQAKMDVEELERHRQGTAAAIQKKAENVVTNELLRNWKTNLLSPTREFLGQVANVLHMDTETVKGFLGDPAKAEALKVMVANQTLSTIRNPQGQTAIPGSASNKDLGVTQNAVINMTNTEEGNKLIQEISEHRSDFTVRVGKELEKWRKQNGTNLDKPAKSGEYKGQSWYEARDEIYNKAAKLPDNLVKRMEPFLPDDYKRDVLPLVDKGFDKLSKQELTKLADPRYQRMLTPAQRSQAEAAWDKLEKQ